MPSRINGLDSKPVRTAPASAVHRRQESDAAPAQPGEPGADVHLSGRASQLAAIEQNLRALPAVDDLRVATVRQRLESGDYKVDPQRIADRLLRLDSELAQRSGPHDRNPLK